MKYDVSDHLLANGLIDANYKSIIKAALSGVVIPHDQILKADPSSPVKSFQTSNGARIKIQKPIRQDKSENGYQILISNRFDSNDENVKFLNASIDFAHDKEVKIKIVLVSNDGCYFVANDKIQYKDRNEIIGFKYFDEEALNYALNFIEYDSLVYGDEVLAKLGLSPDMDKRFALESESIFKLFSYCGSDKDVLLEEIKSYMGLNRAKGSQR